MLVAAIVIGVGVVVVAVGRGGEMTEFSADVRPLDADFATAADVALLRPPWALWGYDKRFTDQALNLVARTVTERDIEIGRLRRQIADLQRARENPPDPRQDAVAQPDSLWRLAGGASAAVMHPGQADSGSFSSPFVRREASPTPPPAQTQPWSAWERQEAAPPDQGETVEPEARG